MAPGQEKKQRTPHGRSGARARRARRRRLVMTAVILFALLLALVGAGTWMLLSRRPQVTVRVYPMAYEAAIRIRAAENDIDPALVAAVILAESDYDPEAVSEANAQGLMQLMPPTAEWIAGKFDETYVEGCLFDADTNIKYGCWYLGWLTRRFDGDVTCAVAAYHAGQGRVDEWLSDPNCSPDGATLTAIPSQATDTYVKRVLEYYEKYRELYAKEG